MKKVISANQAVSQAVRAARAQVIAAYPITPQSTIVEMLATFCAQGELPAKFINVESEHSAMAACIAAASVGARTFTATSSQGLALMHEMLHYASGLRFPIVMANVNRAMGSPFNLKADLSDSLSQRDTGWLQFYCESGQEVFDTIIQSFKISEQVLLPVMVNLEGFILSHTYEIVDVPEQDQIDAFLPRPAERPLLDVEGPMMMGATTDLYINFRYKMHQAMEEAKTVCRKVDEEYRAAFGRGYEPVQSYRCAGADIVLVTAGMCIGCKACLASCPYDARFVHPDGYTDKCTFCVHRVKDGLDPACVSVCPTRCMTFGDLDDPNSEANRLLASRRHHAVNTAAGTGPRIHYLD